MNFVATGHFEVTGNYDRHTAQTKAGPEGSSPVVRRQTCSPRDLSSIHAASTWLADLNPSLTQQC